MPLLPYALARPFLFGLDAETAHELTLSALAKGHGTPLQWAWCAPRVEDPITLAGLRFPNRVGLAAGLDKNARCIDGLGAMGFGFVEVGTVTPKAQPGNPKPRMFRLPQANALINRLGFNNDGLDAFISHVRQARFRSQNPGAPMLLGLNIGTFLPCCVASCCLRWAIAPNRPSSASSLCRARRFLVLGELMLTVT